MKRNLTLKLDEELLREARVLAARRDTSISALVSELLETLIRQEAGYSRAKQRALARLKKGYHFDWSPPVSRDELHDR